MAKVPLNKKPIKIIVVSVISLCALGVLIYGILSAVFYSNWSSYDYYRSFETANGMYDVVLDKSYPLLPPDTVLRFKIKCRENASGKEVKYTEFRFSVPKDNTVEWFEFEEVNSEKAKLIVNSFHEQEVYEFNWNDIFST